MPERNIQVSNAPELGGIELTEINNALVLSYDKLQRIVNNELQIALHFKEAHASGRRAQHEVHLRLTFPGKTVVASETGWNAVSTVQKALHVLERETIESVKAWQEKR